MLPPYSQLPWRTTASQDGVVVRELGDGREIVFLMPGLEGSGESCLHLALPVIRRVAAAGASVRLALIDYAAEQHPTFDALVATIDGLCREAARGRVGVLWGQSFGNLLVAEVSRRKGLDVRQVALVSPFTGLPQLKIELGLLSMDLGPDWMYRACAEPGGRVIFGPVGDQPHQPFFAALRDASPTDFARRLRWLRSTVFDRAFEASAAPTRAWLGGADRLVDLSAQLTFFRGLARRHADYHLTLVPGAGHVVLPTWIVQRVCNDLVEWLLTR
jgi:pimeloyl-ACP methyl ester carboxylesterase